MIYTDLFCDYKEGNSVSLQLRKLTEKNEDITNYFYTDTSNATNIITISSRINIFIGANNVGKSRFMRKLFYSGRKVKELEKEDYLSVIDYLNSDIDINPVFKDKLKFKERFAELTNLIYHATEVNNTVGEMYSNLYNEQFYKNLQRKILGNENSNEIYGINDSIRRKLIQKRYSFDVKVVDRKRVYIPVLRSLRRMKKSYRDFYTMFNSKVILDNNTYESVIKKLDIDHYKYITKVDYFPNLISRKNNNMEVFTGYSLNDELRDCLLGDFYERQLVKDFEDFLKINYFSGENISFIPKLNDDLVIKIGENEERLIYNLGDGLQSIIIMTWPLFKYKESNIDIYIEEPENLLHPGFIRKFFELACTEEFENVRFYCTTHSNHCLDFSNNPDDLSVFKFIENKSKKITDIQKSDFRDFNIHNIIGSRFSSMMLSNSIIWIEGITDRIVLNHYIKLYESKYNLIESLVENYDYGFLEYSGSNIAHWSFFTKDVDSNNIARMDNRNISGNYILVADGDGIESDGISFKSVGIETSVIKGKLERFASLSDDAKEKFLLLPCREIENSAGEDVLKKYITSNLKKGKNISFKKTSKTLQHEPIAKFIKDYLLKTDDLKNDEIWKRKIITDQYKKKIGNQLNQKITYSNFILDNVTDFGELPEYTKDFVSNLYNMILKYNS